MGTPPCKLAILRSTLYSIVGVEHTTHSHDPISPCYTTATGVGWIESRRIIWMASSSVWWFQLSALLPAVKIALCIGELWLITSSGLISPNKEEIWISGKATPRKLSMFDTSCGWSNDIKGRRTLSNLPRNSLKASLVGNFKTTYGLWHW